MNKYKIDLDILRQLGAEIYGDWENLMFSSVSLDSRFTQKDMLFVGLKGRYKDGADFGVEAAIKGATGLIVSKKLDYNVPQIVTDNVWSLVYRYSLAIRKKYQNPLIAVCGSAGKTTMKNHIAQLLPGNILYTKRSFNLKLSICCTMLLLDNNIDYFVVECGHSSLGEMDDLGRLLNPTYIIYSTIGEEHMETFKTIENIQIEQSKILNYTKNSFIADKDYVEFVKSKTNISNNGLFIELEIIDNKIIYKNKTYYIPIDSTTAITNTFKKIILLMDLLKVQLNENSFMNLNTICMRGNSIKTQKRTIFDYSFNFNKTSLLNTIEFIELFCKQNNTKIDFIYGLMGDINNIIESDNINSLNMLVNNQYINKVYTVNIKFDHEKSKELNESEDFPNLLSTVVFQGSKHNNLIKIITSLISYDSNQPQSLLTIYNL